MKKIKKEKKNKKGQEEGIRKELWDSELGEWHIWESNLLIGKFRGSPTTRGGEYFGETNLNFQFLFRYILVIYWDLVGLSNLFLIILMISLVGLTVKLQYDLIYKLYTLIVQGPV